MLSVWNTICPAQLAVALLVACLPALARAEGRHYHVQYPPSEQAGELSMESNYYLWIPDNGRPIRGIIVHQHGCGDGAEQGGVTASHDLHWQALARKWNCALMGSSYRAQGANCRLWCDPRNGSEQTFLRAIDDFAREANRPELKRAPWCLWGHSGGAFWASLMQPRHPRRIVAMWLRSGTAFTRWRDGEIPEPEIPTAAYRIPVMCNPGAKEKDDERFRGAWDGLIAMFREYRAQDAPIGFAPDPRTAHECGDSRYLAIPYFDACLALRLPEASPEKSREVSPEASRDGQSQEVTLRDVPLDRGWLAPLLGERAVPAAEFEGDRPTAVWLPGPKVARAWSEYVRTGATDDATAPPAPTNVTRLRDAEGNAVLSWEARADFESGLSAFLILRDGKQIARIPERPIGRFGRPLFQSMSYHDTPSAPLPEMKFVLDAETLDADPQLQVVAVNSVGLKSPPSDPARRR